MSIDRPSNNNTINISASMIDADRHSNNTSIPNDVLIPIIMDITLALVAMEPNIGFSFSKEIPNGIATAPQTIPVNTFPILLSRFGEITVRAIYPKDIMLLAKKI